MVDKITVELRNQKLAGTVMQTIDRTAYWDEYQGRRKVKFLNRWFDLRQDLTTKRYYIDVQNPIKSR
jgi:hypothetical protein